MSEAQPPPRVALGTITREWSRIGVTGFGGPPFTPRCCASAIAELAHAPL